MPLIPEAITSVGSLKEALKIGDTSQDNLLTSIINRVSWWLEHETHRKLVCRNFNGKGTVFQPTGVASEDFLYLDRAAVNEYGQGELYLPCYPVQRSTAPSSVANALAFKLDVIQNRGSSLAGGETWDTTSYVEWDNFLVDNDNGIIRTVGGRFPTGMRTFRVTCTAGLLYSPTAAPWVPPDLESVAIDLCKQMFRESKNISSERIGSWSRTYDLKVPDMHNADILARYTRILT